MKVREILECCLYAENLDAAAAWYADVLGLEAFSRAADRHVFFRAGNRCFFLFNPHATRDPASTENDIPRHGATGAGHVCFAVAESDLDSWRARLQSNRIAIEREIEWPNGARSLYVRDPAGNSVELATPRMWDIAEVACFGTVNGA